MQRSGFPSPKEKKYKNYADAPCLLEFSITILTKLDKFFDKKDRTKVFLAFLIQIEKEKESEKVE